MRGNVTVRIQANPERVWDLVSDITKTGEYSPETFEAEWSDGASGPALGARFRGHVKRNQRGPTYWTTCVVTACDRPREFAFDVLAGKSATKALNSWRYVITPVDGGASDVTESFELADGWLTRAYWAVAGRARGRTNERNMRATLENIKAVAERDRGTGT